jgi:hypothetical protein
MRIDRRRVLCGATLLLAGGRHAFAAMGSDEDGPDFISACRRADGSFALLLLTQRGRIVREIALGARGHDIAVDRRSGRAVAFARRPGFFAVAFDIAGREEPLVFAPEPGRHFFGHGVFADGGRLLLTTEHDVETGSGLIGIYDVTGGFKRAGEFPSHGVGPHEAILLSDGRTLAVANGGIATDPATGRENIDVSAMKPSLALIDWKSGDLFAQHELPPEMHRLSIRHLAANARGEVWFGGQWQGSVESAPELLGRASRDKPISILEPAVPLGVALKGYIGSVAMHQDGRFLAASAPRAGRIVYIDTETGRVGAETALGDGCGLAAPQRDVFAVSSGFGEMRLEKPGEAPLSRVSLEGVSFDNHLRFVR